MKKLKIVGAAGSAAVLTLVAACGGSVAGDGDSITLRAATGLSNQHGWWDGTMVPWMDRVEELTDGQVEFETFVGGELVDVPDETEAIMNGTTDVALILPIYQSDQFPLTEVTMLPLQHSDALIASEAWRNLVESDQELADGKTFYDSQFGDRGIKAFPVSATQEYSISTTGREVNSAADVSGLSLRTPSRIHELYAASTGIDSVTIPAVEMFDSLSRGAFDGAFYSIADWSGYGFQDLFEYTITGINFGHFNALIGMSESTWDDLPDNVQEAMTQAHDEVYEAGAREWVDRGAAMVEENTSAGGQFVEFDSLPSDARDRFLAGVDVTWDEYADQLEAQGLPGEALVQRWYELITEAGGEVPENVQVVNG